MNELPGTYEIIQMNPVSWEPHVKVSALSYSGNDPGQVLQGHGFRVLEEMPLVLTFLQQHSALI